VKVSSTELPPRQVSLEIEVDKDRLDHAMDQAYRRLAGRVEVPGFRRGKAPRSMVERMIGHDRIVEEALDQLVPAVVNEAMEQEKVEPYTRPRVESIEFDPLRLKAVVGLAPRVELGDYKSALRIDRDEPNVGETEIDGVIQRVRESYAQWAPVERPVALGDTVGADVRISVEGRESALIDSKDTEFLVDPNGPRGEPAPGYVDELIGMSAGETKTFTLNMPEDYRDKEVAGKPAQFEVTVHWVKERELPELDDAFAQQVGDYADVAALRTAVEAQLRTSEEERVRGKLEEEAVNKLVEISSIEYPPQLVDFQAQYMLDSFRSSVERQGLQLNQYLRLVGKEQDAFEQEIREQAETRVRRTLALDAFADAEQIPSSQGDSDAAAESRSMKALARLIEMATGDGRDGGQSAEDQKPAAEKTADRAGTSDTGTRTSDSDAPTAPAIEEDRGTA
jgi:trigger factor